LLLPPSLRDWLPEGHLAYYVSDVVDQLDLSAIERHARDLHFGLLHRRQVLCLQLRIVERQLAV
jgi:hypothetical protein